jgi:hypothetical protein
MTSVRFIKIHTLYFPPNVCAPPQLVITGTDHLTIHPVGYHFEGQAVHPSNFKVMFVSIYIDTAFSHRGGAQEWKASSRGNIQRIIFRCKQEKVMTNKEDTQIKV